MEAGERRAGLAVAAASGREAQGMGEPLEPGCAGRMMPRVELLLRWGICPAGPSAPPHIPPCVLGAAPGAPGR